MMDGATVVGDTDHASSLDWTSRGANAAIQLGSKNGGSAVQPGTRIAMFGVTRQNIRAAAHLAEAQRLGLAP